jgi:hypothetical protein
LPHVCEHSGIPEFGGVLPGIEESPGRWALRTHQTVNVPKARGFGTGPAHGLAGPSRASAPRSRRRRSAPSR